MWQSRGLVQASQDGRSRSAPAVAAYRGALWCLWAGMDHNVGYAATTKDGNFGRPAWIRPPRNYGPLGLPLVANLDGVLHAVFYRDSTFLHYVYDDPYDVSDGEPPGWRHLASGSVGINPPDWRHLASGSVGLNPSLVAFKGQLILAFTYACQLQHCVWAPKTPSSPKERVAGPNVWKHVVVDDDQIFPAGRPVLCVFNDILHVSCQSAVGKDRKLGFRYVDGSGSLSTCEDIGIGAFGSEANSTSFGGRFYLGFLQDDGVRVVAHADGEWKRPEDVAGGTVGAAEPPQLAVLNGRLHCIFTDNTAARRLRWYSRPLSNCSPESWMKHIPDDELISHLTIPGTHDSAACGALIFVRTQHLSITEQLALGIRFLDLRLRLEDSGRLYCYHGGIPAHWPLAPLSFQSAMDEVWTFLRGPDGSRPPTETVLISINNDDSSDEQLANPARFYRAVETAISSTPNYPDGSPRWSTGGGTPTLGEVRGRAVLLRRYRGDPVISLERRLGIDLSKGWLDNNPEFTIVTPSTVMLHLQDKWRYTKRTPLEVVVDDKTVHVQRLMKRAASSRETHIAGDDADGDEDEDGWFLATRDGDSPTAGDEHDDWTLITRGEEDDWFINFCSAVGEPRQEFMLAPAKSVAVGARKGVFGPWVDGMNVRTRDHLKQSVQTWTGRRRLGIVNMDFPELPVDSDLVHRLIAMNFLHRGTFLTYPELPVVTFLTFSTYPELRLVKD